MIVIFSTGSESASLITSSGLISFGKISTDVFGSIISGTAGVVAAAFVVVTDPRSKRLVVSCIYYLVLFFFQVPAGRRIMFNIALESS